MLGLQQISDRRESEEVLIAHCHAINVHVWDVLDTVFVPDAWG
jgi:hypothetical protein